MKFESLFYLLGCLIILSSCAKEPEEPIEETYDYKVEHAGVFKAEIDGNQWEAKKISATYPDGFGRLAIVAGIGSDTTIFVSHDDPQIDTYKRDTLNPEESAHPQMMQLKINGIIEGAGVENFGWKDGELEIVSFTEDSIEMKFNFSTKFTSVKNGYAKLYIGE